MRSSKSRTRSKQNRPRTLGNIINRVFESSGPEGKVRGTPQQVIEKYQQLARDAQLSNDRVAAENFSQHAEHYTRMLAEANREMAVEQEARQQQYNQNGGQNAAPNGGQGGNQNGGHNGNQNDSGQGNQTRDGQHRDHQPRDNQRRDNQNRDNQNREQRQPWRDDRAAHGNTQGNDQPDTAPVMDMSADSGLVETPEARHAQPEAAPRREPRPPRPDRPQTDRPQSERAPRNPDQQPKRERGPRPQADLPLPEFITSAPVMAAPLADPTPADPGTDAAAKPRRARAPKKPKDDGAPDSGAPREASE